VGKEVVLTWGNFFLFFSPRISTGPIKGPGDKGSRG